PDARDTAERQVSVSCSSRNPLFCNRVQEVPPVRPWGGARRSAGPARALHRVRKEGREEERDAASQTHRCDGCDCALADRWRERLQDHWYSRPYGRRGGGGDGGEGR